MRKLSAEVGSATDKQLIKQFKTDREKHQSGERILNVLETGNHAIVEHEWTRWIDSLNDIEDGLLCAVSTDWGVMDDMLNRESWSEIRNQFRDQDMRKLMKKSIVVMNWVVDLIESEEIRSLVLEEDWNGDGLVSRCIKVVVIIFRVTAIRHVL